MRIVGRGWDRDCGAKEIMGADLENGYNRLPFGSHPHYLRNVVYLKNMSNGDVEIRTGPHSLTLGGKYQVIVTLTKDDILRLFAEAFEDDKLLPLAERLAKLSSAKHPDEAA